MITKTTINMPIRISPHHLTLTPPIVAKVHDKIGHLTRIAMDVVGADVVLRLHRSRSLGNTFSASARLILPGGDIHATAINANLYKAISELESRLARRLRKRKTRIENRMESGRSRDGFTSAARLEGGLLSA